MRSGQRLNAVAAPIFASIFSVLFLGLAGCMSLSTNKPPGPWHEAYQPIDDPESLAFISNGLVRVVAEFGEPAIPVNQVLLRRSRKTEAARRYRIGEDFSSTHCHDSTNGVFVIYIGVDRHHANYFAMLGHECAHLINPAIADWYMEGIATVFSEELCLETGKKWGDWKRHFMRSRRHPYARSYRMMLELKEHFPEMYPLLVRDPVPNGKGPEWFHIDIDAWLAALPEARRQEALEIIEPHVDVLRKQVNKQYDFAVPEALK